MAYTGTSIVDYLKSVGQASDYTSRTALASKYGIQNYTGTAQQNTQLLSTLNKPASSQVTQPPSTISATSLQTQPSVPLATPPAPTSNADVIAAGATDTSKQLTTAQTAAQSATDTQFNDLKKQVGDLFAGTTTHGADTITAEQNAGVPQLQQQLQGVNSQIQTKLAEFNKIQASFAQTNQALEGKTIPLNLISGKEAEANRALQLQKNSYGADVGLLQAQAQGLQGQVELAKSTADRAVDLKYEDAKSMIAYKLQQVRMIYPLLSAAEKKTADTLLGNYTSAQDQMEIQVANQKDKNATLLNLLQQYPDAGISLSDSIEQANTKITTSSKIYAKNIASTGGAVSGVTYTPGADPIVDSWISNVLNGNATMQQVPTAYRNAVSEGITQQPTASYSPLAASRFTVAANRIVNNFIQLPQYQLTANGLPYLQRIDAAMKTPGSISDQDLLDSLTKLNTAGNAISDAQVKIITDGKSFTDAVNVWTNKFNNGGVLSDNQRQQIQQIAQAIYANYQKGYQPVYDQATSQLTAAGIPQAFWTIPNLNNLSGQAGVGTSGQQTIPTGSNLWNW